MIRKILHRKNRKIKISQYEPHREPGVTSCVPGGSAVPTLLMASVVLLLLTLRW